MLVLLGPAEGSLLLTVALLSAAEKAPTEPERGVPLMDGVADNAIFSVSARGASFVRVVVGGWMCNVRCGGRFEVNFLLGMGVVGRPVGFVVVASADVIVVFLCSLSLVAIAVSELALRVLSLMTSPVTVGETAVAKLQLDIFQQYLELTTCFVKLQFQLFLTTKTLINCYCFAR